LNITVSLRTQKTRDGKVKALKRPTQVDVAQKAGVSRAMVSYVVNGRAGDQVPIADETRLRILRAIEELGYEPDARAQALRSGDSKTIGLILPDIRNPHFWENADGVEQEARAGGYHMLRMASSRRRALVVIICSSPAWTSMPTMGKKSLKACRNVGLMG
jgi:hypothetical protein